MALQLRPKLIIYQNPNFIRLLSTSSSSSLPNNGEEEENKKKDSFGSYFSDLKASLKQPSSSSPLRRISQLPPINTTPSPFYSSSKPKTSSLEEIQQNLSQFRSRTAPPLPNQTSSSSSSTGKTISFQELYRRNVIGKNEGGGEGEGSNTNEAATNRNVKFAQIHESLSKLRSETPSQNRNLSSNKKINPLSLKEFQNNLRIQPDNEKNSSVFVRSETVPMFLNDRRSMVKDDVKSAPNELIRDYKKTDLGERLIKLRPSESNKLGKNWFSLKELNERLIKLRELEEKEGDERLKGGTGITSIIRTSLNKIASASDAKKHQSAVQHFELFKQLEGNEKQDYLNDPPKEHLVEKYFHPDNMSSAEKLKLELKKVRDEFKMSESDCGSSRVQVAQLTTKIKHLSSVLHKKDKHSRKGLQEMVQRRKKLLRYLRRTDWDSYCLCLSKLGLRDNPDYKN
ncbi:hypothetical protein AQUCO_01600125v1 [Aquilegia coerulea]|uniref:Small ribosomal subunit protein uS15c n=1 Tax=Aquilegia coerulea TaxID=218851 RepID=A0A2G5DQF7_AQUCA|nr:hypothetical protein AQUCO_01600125v1 [Aquilegia coerulea]